MIKLPAYFTGFRSRSDGSGGLAFTTQELNPDDFAEFKKIHNAFGWLLFKENELSEKDIPSMEAPEEGLSPSEILFKRMFVYYKEKKLDADFNTWRAQQLDAIGQKYLEKLQ